MSFFYCTLYIVHCICSETNVPAEEVCGKCVVLCGEDIEGDVMEYLSKDTNSFYFMEVHVNHCLLRNVPL